MLYLSGITVRKIRNQDEYRQVLGLRREVLAAGTALDLREEKDFALNSTLLLAHDNEGHVVGTLRILDRTLGAIELDDAVAVEPLLGTGRRCAEATRLAVAAHWERESIIFALFKAYYRYCAAHAIATALISSSEDLAARFPHLFLEPAKASGLYQFNATGGALEKHTFILDMNRLPEKLRGHAEMNAFLFQLAHRNISFS